MPHPLVSRMPFRSALWPDASWEPHRFSRNPAISKVHEGGGGPRSMEDGIPTQSCSGSLTETNFYQFSRPQKMGGRHSGLITDAKEETENITRDTRQLLLC